MKTYVANAQDRERNWLLVDAEGTDPSAVSPPRSRMRCAVSASPPTTPHVDTGDFVIVVNAEKISVTGQKLRRRSTTATRDTRAA
jgi:large subunit ribosomal protein L13